MARQALRSLDRVALGVALDRAEEEGLTLLVPAPRETPAECVYLKYIGAEQLALLSARLPHSTVQSKTPGGAGKNKRFLLVFRREAIVHVLGFLLAAEELPRCMRSMDSIDKKYWKAIAG